MVASRNTAAIVAKAAEKSEQKRQAVIRVLQDLRARKLPITLSVVCQHARVSKTFLYDPKHADLRREIERLKAIPPEPLRDARNDLKRGKSDQAKDLQIQRLKERTRQLEMRVNQLEDERELLLGKLADLAK